MPSLPRLSASVSVFGNIMYVTFSGNPWLGDTILVEAEDTNGHSPSWSYTVQLNDTLSIVINALAALVDADPNFAGSRSGNALSVVADESSLGITGSCIVNLASLGLIKIPFLNPVFYTEENFTNPSLFDSKHIDDFQFPDTIFFWEQFTDFKRIWKKGDEIRQQLQSGIGPVNISLLDCEGNVIDTQIFQQLQQNVDEPGEFIYQHDYDTSSISAGVYQFRLTFGSPVQKSFISERINISENIENTIHLQYTHFKNKGDVLFETGFTPYVRLYGCMKYQQPGSKDTVYEDQVLNEELLRSDPFDTYTLYLSNELGIPDYLIKKLNRILGCSTILIDGRQYTKSENSKLEETSVEDYPMRGWKIEMRETINRSSKLVLANGGNPNAKQIVVITADSKGFGNDTTGNQAQVEDII